jgi:hypothetical protein
MDTAERQPDQWLMPERDDATATNDLSDGAPPPVSGRPTWLKATAWAGAGLALGAALVLTTGQHSINPGTATTPPTTAVQLGVVPGVPPGDADELGDEGSRG